MFVNARTDVCLVSPGEERRHLVPDAIERARIYVEAGTDGLFVPGLVDPELIAEMVNGTAIPAYVITMSGAPIAAALARAGVARISHGSGPYRAAMPLREEHARDAFGGAGS